MILALTMTVATAAVAPTMLPGFTFGEADYPPAALRAGVQGRVGFRVTVDPGGVPHDCTITEPSSSPALDAKTCEMVSARMRFAAARDAHGHAVASPYDGHIRWKIDPSEFAFLSEGTTRVSFSFAPDGSIDRCATEASGHAANAGAFTCAMLPQEVMPFLFGSPTTDLAGATIEARFATGADAASPPVPIAGDIKVTLAARFTITAQGGIEHCVPSGSVVVINGRIDACQGLALATRDRPHPFAPAAARPASVSFKVYVVRRGTSGSAGQEPPLPH